MLLNENSSAPRILHSQRRFTAAQKGIVKNDNATSFSQPTFGHICVAKFEPLYQSMLR